MMAFEIVVVGTSLGGLNALKVLVAGLPGDFALPVAVVQHRKAGYDDILSGILQVSSALPVIQVMDKDSILPGRVYIAPADYHLLVGENLFMLSTEAPVCCARPSIDVLFESVADAYKDRAIGVILTGASADGSRGLAKIKQYGGMAIVEQPETAEDSTMPKAAITATCVDRIMPLSEIPLFLSVLCRSSRR